MYAEIAGETAAKNVAGALDGLWSGLLSERDIIDHLKAALNALDYTWHPPQAEPKTLGEFYQDQNHATRHHAHCGACGWQSAFYRSPTARNEAAALHMGENPGHTVTAHTVLHQESGPANHDDYNCVVEITEWEWPDYLAEDIFKRAVIDTLAQEHIRCVFVEKGKKVTP